MVFQNNRREAIIAFASSPLLLPDKRYADHAIQGNGIDPRRFGAICDGVSDDTDAISRSIENCLASDPPKPLIISGPCLIRRSIIINRPVDKSSYYFNIMGIGPGAGFVTDKPIKIFDSTLNYSNDPVSAGFIFWNIVFQGRHPESCAFSGGLMRVLFQNCQFIEISCLKSNIYTQEWGFFSCYATRWGGYFFSSAGGYHITSTGSKYQFGEGDSI